MRLFWSGLILFVGALIAWLVFISLNKVLFTSGGGWLFGLSMLGLALMLISAFIKHQK